VKRSRGRGRRPQNNNSNNHHHNHNRAFDSTGPDVKIRGTAAHVYEKYLQLARDAGSAGDRVMQENYLQHAEHYYRILMAQGAQLGANQQQQQPQFVGQGQQPNGNVNGNGNGDGRPVQGNGNENYHQQLPAQQALAGSAPSFSLADADDGDDGDDAG
jgi:Domain of unknown function (DUF4167)